MTTQTDHIPGIPVPQDVEQHLVKPDGPVEGTVVASEICTVSKKAAGIVRHVAIDVSGTPLEGHFHAGQSFGVVPPGETEQGRPHKLRLYSISSPSAGEDGQGKVLATAVKRVLEEHKDDHTLFQGVCSNYLCDLQIGDKVLLTGPAGKRFVMPADLAAHDYVFFATGTGMAPFRAMLGDLDAAGFPSKVLMVMGSPYTSDLLYHQWLLKLEERHENMTYLPTISRELNEDCGRKLYVQDRLDTHADLFGSVLSSDRTLMYVCGIAGMELGIFQKMARVLPPNKLASFLQLDPEIAGDVAAWDRRMIPRKIKPTKRMFLEVY